MLNAAGSRQSAASSPGKKTGQWLRFYLLHAACCLLPAVFLAPAAKAQQNAPRIGYVYPAGGQLGTALEVSVGGQFLGNAAQAYVSGSGIEARIVGYTRPLTQQQINELREKAQDIQKGPRNSEAQRQLAEIRAQITDRMRKRANPTLSESIRLEIKISEAAEPGPRELRLETPNGISNPIVFVVGRLPEYSEPPREISLTREDNAPDPERQVSLPATVNGQIIPRFPARPAQEPASGDFDRYRFQARRGQHLVITVNARSLNPYLADAVPGWFQAVVTLYDAEGKELAYDDDYRFDPDPVIHYEVPKDGAYVVEIADALSRGREDFVYRMSIGELPFITGIYPLGGKAGAQASLEISGWNLSGSRLTLDGRNRAPGIYPVSVGQGNLISNAVPFVWDTLEPTAEKEPNGAVKGAQKLTLPTIVNGRIESPGDWDVFSFDGRAGETIVAEVSARRLGSPLDSFVRLTGPGGRQIALSDDHDDKGSGLVTHQADSLITVALPASGTYYLFLGDAQQRGGTEYSYRLRLGPPQPDFQLWVTPSSLSSATGLTLPLTVSAVRRDDFSGDIALALKDAPKGFVLSGGLIPAGQDRVRLTLTIPQVPPLREPLHITLQGRAMIQNHDVVRTALPAEDMMQAFAYRHLVPAGSLLLAAPRRSPSTASIRVMSENPLRIRPGDTVRIPIRIPVRANSNLANVLFELSEPPEGIELKGKSAIAGGTELTLWANPEKVKPGMKGNLIVSVFLETAATGANAAAQAAQRRRPLGVLPALPFEVRTKNGQDAD